MSCYFKGVDLIYSIINALECSPEHPYHINMINAYKNIISEFSSIEEMKEFHIFLREGSHDKKLREYYKTPVDPMMDLDEWFCAY